METARPKLICTQPGPGASVELQTDETPRRLVGAIFFTFNERNNRLTEAQAQEWAEYLVGAANCHEELVEALRAANSFVSAIVDMTEGRGCISETSVSKPGVTIKRHARQILPGLRAALVKLIPGHLSRPSSDSQSCRKP